jgi:hypothetical protein
MRDEEKLNGRNYIQRDMLYICSREREQKEKMKERNRNTGKERDKIKFKSRIILYKLIDTQLVKSSSL